MIPQLRCDRCDRPVDTQECERDEYREVYRVTVECHGETETLTIPKWRTVDGVVTAFWTRRMPASFAPSEPPAIS